MSGNSLVYQETDFNKNDPCDLDLWPCKLQTNKGHVLTMTNQHVKYESSMINIKQKLFFLIFPAVTLVTLIFDLVN